MRRPAHPAGEGKSGCPERTLGSGLAWQARRSHSLAAELWASGILEACILATLVDQPARVTRRQMNHWARDFDSIGRVRSPRQNLFR